MLNEQFGEQLKQKRTSPQHCRCGLDWQRWSVACRVHNTSKPYFTMCLHYITKTIKKHLYILSYCLFLTDLFKKWEIYLPFFVFWFFFFLYLISATITDMIEKSLAIAAMLRFMMSYVRYISELPNVHRRISLSRGISTMPIKNMVATKVIRSR